MNNRSSGRSIRLAAATAIGLSTAAVTASALTPSTINSQSAIHDSQFFPLFTYAHDGILGTSMELILQAQSASQADHCHQQVLSEIERLRKILSTYDPASEIEQAKSAPAWPLQRPCFSPELTEMLQMYQTWQTQTQGAIDLNLAGVIALWKSAKTPPTASALQKAHAAPFAWNVDALGKGYIIDKAVTLARSIIPAGLLNIGGDIRAWGREPWRIGIADPGNPADNAPPLATFDLQNAAVATSGSYARYQIQSAPGCGLAASAASGLANQKISHLINPRTLSPANPNNAAAIIAPDCITANAISTAACVLESSQSIPLANEHAHAYLITSASGTVENLTPVHGRLIPQPIQNAAATAWPADFQVNINITLKVNRGPKVKRPYVAVWVEDSKGKPVRSITIWGTQPKYFRELTEWWRATKGDQKLLRSITRATRDPGKYTVTWDGKDDAGTPLPKGDYTIKMEINREHGRHVGELVKLACQDKKVTATLKGTAESEESTVEYGPKDK